MPKSITQQTRFDVEFTVRDVISYISVVPHLEIFPSSRLRENGLLLTDVDVRCALNILEKKLGLVVYYSCLVCDFEYVSDLTDKIIYSHELEITKIHYHEIKIPNSRKAEFLENHQLEQLDELNDLED